MDDNVGSPNVVPDAVARVGAIVETMRRKPLDWFWTTECTLKGHLSMLETGGTQMGSEVQAGVAATVIGGSRMKCIGSGHVGGLS